MEVYTFLSLEHVPRLQAVFEASANIPPYRPPNKEITYIYIFIFFTQTPVEILHTILLGPVKYLFAKTMGCLSPQLKMKVKAKIEAFDFSAFSRRLASSFVKIHKSCVGRDFKLWMQISVFIFDGIVTNEELEVWCNLSEVIIIIMSHFSKK